MRRCLLCLLTMVLFLPLSACAAGRTPKEQLADFMAAYPNLPAGRIYESAAREGEEGYLSPALADALYREENGENALTHCADYALFLTNSPTGGEIAFFYCIGQDAAARVADMCATRIARVRRAMPGADICRGACVLRRGNTVILLLLPDNAHAQEICRTLD